MDRDGQYGQIRGGDDCGLEGVADRFGGIAWRRRGSVWKTALGRRPMARHSVRRDACGRDFSLIGPRDEHGLAQEQERGGKQRNDRFG